MGGLRKAKSDENPTKTYAYKPSANECERRQKIVRRLRLRQNPYETSSGCFGGHGTLQVTAEIDLPWRTPKRLKYLPNLSAGCRANQPIACCIEHRFSCLALVRKIARSWVKYFSESCSDKARSSNSITHALISQFLIFIKASSNLRLSLGVASSIGIRGSHEGHP